MYLDSGLTIERGERCRRVLATPPSLSLPHPAPRMCPRETASGNDRPSLFASGYKCLPSPAAVGWSGAEARDRTGPDRGLPCAGVLLSTRDHVPGGVQGSENCVEFC